jgi:hypothetical protein
MDVEGQVATEDVHFDSCTGERPGSKRARVKAEPQAKRPRRPQPDPNVPYVVRLWLPDLELGWPCTLAEVTTAFRRLAFKYHPDTGGPTADTSAFIRCKLAYDRLKQLLPEKVAV